LFVRTLVAGSIVAAAFLSGSLHVDAAPAANGWTETTLHAFQNGPDSAAASSALMADAAGNLYGETQGAYLPCPDSHAAHGPIGIRAVCGTVYELIPPSKPGGMWAEKILYAFNGHDGTCCPRGGLTFDAAGNLFGAMGDGLKGAGALFELSPTKSGPWSRTVIYRFRNGADGNAPTGSMVFDQHGNLFGVTALGGSTFAGTVFEVSPPQTAGEPWVHRVLLSFTNDGPNGFLPQGGPVLDAAGALYGTTLFGGTFTNFCQSGCGVVYRLVPSRPGGNYVQQVLLRFNGANDGALPQDGLVFDRAGSLYGTTSLGQPGGAAPAGSVFRLAPPGRPGASWTETVLYAFRQYPNDAAYPHAGVRFDAAGDLYGTSQDGGGSRQVGTVFRLAPPPPGGTTWTESLLHIFGAKNDGIYPDYDVLVGKGGVYVTTMWGGASPNCTGEIPGCGAAFALSP